MTADRRYPNWVRFSGVGLELVGVVVAFALIGYWIDRQYGTAPWALLGSIVLGIVGGLYNLVKQSLEALREAGEEDREDARGRKQGRS